MWSSYEGRMGDVLAQEETTSKVAAALADKKRGIQRGLCAAGVRDEGVRPGNEGNEARVEGYH